jgi:hypothetical protein
MRSIHASVGERRDLVNGLAMSRGVFSTECLTCTSWSYMCLLYGERAVIS